MRKIEGKNILNFLKMGTSDTVDPEALRKSLSNSSYGKDWGDSRYKILSPLGRGSMGVVFLAWDNQEGKDVALKVLSRRCQGFTSEETLRFQREIKHLSSLGHPNIIQLYSSGKEIYQGEETFYYTMEYIRGKVLSEALQGIISSYRAIKITSYLASAVDYMHRHKIIHRDLKPSNIILVGGEVPKVLDFGLSRIYNESETFRPTGTHALLGTPQFMAPEQFFSPQKAGVQSDLYSLGALLFKMLTGRLPHPQLETWQFKTQRDLETLKDIFSENRVEISPGEWLHLDRDIERICTKALEKDLKKRYRWGAELKEDLEGYLLERNRHRDHFFVLPSGKTLCFPGYGTIGTDERGELSFERESLQMEYGKILPILSTCQIFIKRDLKINGEIFKEGMNSELRDGDRVEIQGTLVSYKRNSKDKIGA